VSPKIPLGLPSAIEETPDGLDNFQRHSWMILHNQHQGHKFFDSKLMLSSLHQNAFLHYFASLMLISRL
jgi:hypothetical protein